MKERKFDLWCVVCLLVAVSSLVITLGAIKQNQKDKQRYDDLKANTAWMKEKIKYLQWRESTATGHTVPAEQYVQ